MWSCVVFCGRVWYFAVVFSRVCVAVCVAMCVVVFVIKPAFWSLSFSDDFVLVLVFKGTPS